MPVSIAMCIMMMIPIFTALGARIFLKEKMTIWDLISMLSAFAGVIMINDPMNWFGTDKTELVKK